MKILVTAKRVEDPESKIKVKADGSGIVQEGLKYKINPFDEIAVEEGLRLAAKYGGDVVVVSIGPKEVQEQLRHALAMGATKAVWVNHSGPLDPMSAAALLKGVIEREKPDLAMLGKQSIDDDHLAAVLGSQAKAFLHRDLVEGVDLVLQPLLHDARPVGLHLDLRLGVFHPLGGHQDLHGTTPSVRPA